MKKKLLLLSALTTFAFALSGCDSKDSNTSAVDNSEPATTAEATTEATTEAQDISEQLVDAERGTVENGVYTNDVFKISFPIQDDWYVCSDAEIAQLIGFTADSIDETGVMTAEQFEAATSGTIYDLVFYFSDMQSNVNIVLSNLDMLGMYATLPTEKYAELTVSQLQNITTPKYTFGDITSETYGGSEYTCLPAETDQGYNQKILMKKENGYMVVITLTYFPELESEMQTFLDSFTEVQ